MSAGPRQVGKTTLALSLPGAASGYLHWDAAEHRERILRRELPDARLWVFDEIHKYRPWRNYLKGIYDVRRPKQQILVTGRQPKLLVECKWSDADPDKSLRYLKAKFPNADAWQLSATGRNDYVTAEGIRVAPAIQLLRQLV